MVDGPKSEVPDFTPPQLLSYMVGVYVGVNAISDAFLMVDGPDCIHFKTQFVQGGHDYFSTLTNVSGYHRVVNTALEPARAPLSREDEVQQSLETMASADEVGCLIVTSMSLATIMAVDYPRLCIEVARKTGAAVFHLAGKSLQLDWLGGYAETMAAVAAKIDLEPLAPAESGSAVSRVALVGNLFDRNEEDAAGNVRELRRLLEGIGLDVVSVWFEGCSYEELKDVAQAELIVSLPYGRKAAKVLGARLGVPVVATELPFGLDASSKWLLDVGKAVGKEAEAEGVIHRELAHVIPKLEWVAPFLIQDHKFGYVGDPLLLKGFAELLEVFGGRLEIAVVTNRRGAMRGLSFPTVGHLEVEPSLKRMTSIRREHFLEQKLDCLVTNDTGLGFASPVDHAVVSFGFPSPNVHALYDRPYLGFRGVLAFLEGVTNSIRLHKAIGPMLRKGGGG